MPDYVKTLTVVNVALYQLKEARKELPADAPATLRMPLNAAIRKAEACMQILKAGWRKCPHCGRTTYNKNDIANDFCPTCDNQ